ncbi:Zinc finger RING/FYVE/PHD-type protein [Dioscorea alata]|uniref:Zinc finger RING/FYVE/PHD-type protein n=1 Tax=Dioscorea alata TaxID=55571 RepID=A0ACB7VVG3_DIOAL|nr:Zinc finger RING/FYVE/PHD-type protein [Dioscorea alata]
MGLGTTDPAADDAAGEAVATACSICLDAVSADDGARSIAKLRCGHEFHLDCIGSAFNVKGAMQCPNCRKVEKGNWLFANGSRTLPDFGMSSWPELSLDEWRPDEDLYDLGYSEMAFGLHWCPFGRVAPLPTPFEEGESSPPITFQELFRNHTILMEHPATSSTAHVCPYVAYLHPLQPSSSSNPHIPSESSIDGPPAYHQPWARVPAPANVQNQHALSANELHYRGWEHHPQHSIPTTLTNAADQASVPSATVRVNSDGPPRTGSLGHPYILAHSSVSRTGGPFVSPYPRYVNNSRVQGHVQEHHYLHHNSTAAHGPISGAQRGARSLAPIGPAQLQPPNPNSLYLVPSTGSSGRSIQEVENTGGNHLYAWERDLFAPFPLMPLDRESGWFSHPHTGASSDPNRRTGSWHQHSSERPNSRGRTDGASHWQSHSNRHHFI